MATHYHGPEEGERVRRAMEDATTRSEIDATAAARGLVVQVRALATDPRTAAAPSESLDARIISSQILAEFGAYGKAPSIYRRRLADEIARLREQETKQRQEIERLKAIIERDRTGASRMVTSLRAHVNRWSGIASSRGPYEWDDEEYFKEFGRCLKELGTIANRAEKATYANDWTDSPTTQAAVDAARAPLTSETRDGE